MAMLIIAAPKKDRQLIGLGAIWIRNKFCRATTINGITLKEIKNSK
jgi:hypothetical protein